MLHLKLNLSSLLLRRAKKNVLLGLTHIKNVRTGYFAISHELTVYKWTRDTTCRLQTKYISPLWRDRQQSVHKLNYTDLIKTLYDMELLIH